MENAITVRRVDHNCVPRNTVHTYAQIYENRERRYNSFRVAGRAAWKQQRYMKWETTKRVLLHDYSKQYYPTALRHGNSGIRKIFVWKTTPFTKITIIGFFVLLFVWRIRPDFYFSTFHKSATSLPRINQCCVDHIFFLITRGFHCFKRSIVEGERLLNIPSISIELYNTYYGNIVFDLFFTHSILTFIIVSLLQDHILIVCQK